MRKKIFFTALLLLLMLFNAYNGIYVAAQNEYCDCAEPGLSARCKIKCQIINMQVNVQGDDPESFLGMVLKSIFSFLAVLFFLLIIYGGIIWMTAQGNENKIEQAKKIIIASTIGIAIIFTSYLVTVLIITLLKPG